MKLISRSTAAEMFGVKPSTITRWLKEGKFPAPIRIGRFTRWDEKTILDWLVSQITQTPQIRAIK